MLNLKKIFLIFVIFFFSVFLPAFSKEIINPDEKLAYINVGFWDGLNDEYLSSYIREAVKNNHDLRKASYNVEQFRQNIRVSFAKELPSLSVGADYLGAQVPQVDNFQLDANAFVLPFIANYEADLLLKNRDKTRAETKNYESEKFQEKAVYIALAGDVGAVYINIMKFDKLIEFQCKILKNKEEIYKKTKLRFEGEISSKDELNNAEKSLLDAKSDLTNLVKTRRDLLFQLAVLLGRHPECINDLKRADIDKFAMDFNPPQEISSDVIFSRPDVQKAERKLEKAKIDIRVARKEFLPRFNVTGFWIFNTIAPGSFFSWNASLATLLVGASQDIFAGGRKIANLRIKKTLYEGLFEEYKQTDLIALKEVSASLCMIKDDSEIFGYVAAKVIKESENMRLSSLKYKQGVISQMDLAAEENKLLLLNQNFTEKRAVKFVDFITLYKAVGARL